MYKRQPLDGELFQPERSGVIVADRYDAAIMREAATVTMPAHVRKACTLGFARRASRRLLGLIDPDAEILC